MGRREPRDLQSSLTGYPEAERTRERTLVATRGQVEAAVLRVSGYAVLGIYLVFVLVPFYWLFAASVMYPVDYGAYPPTLLPNRITLDNYVYNVVKNPAGTYFLNSMVVALGTTILSVSTGSLAAYSLHRVRLPFNLNVVLVAAVLLMRMFPAISMALPYFLLMKALGLLDSQIGLIISYSSFILPFVIWLMLGFFRDVPEEIEQAAIVDGCSLWQRFALIALPLVAPGLVAVTILTFIFAWNEFLLAAILTSFKARTLPVQLATFVGDMGLLWGEMSALSVITIVPVLVLALLVQRLLIRGLTFGAVK